MGADRHPRSDAKLKRLDPEVQAKIWAWLNAPKTSMDQVVELARKELGIETSAGAVYEFRSWYWLKLRTERRENRTQQILDDLKRVDPKLTVDQLRAYGSALFMSDAVSDGDSETFMSAARVQLEEKKLDAGIEGFKAKWEQREREIALEEEKFALTKSNLQAEVRALAKNLTAPDAPQRMLQLVEAIDAL